MGFTKEQRYLCRPVLKTSNELFFVKFQESWKAIYSYHPMNKSDVVLHHYYYLTKFCLFNFREFSVFGCNQNHLSYVLIHTHYTADEILDTYLSSSCVIDVEVHDSNFCAPVSKIADSDLSWSSNCIEVGWALLEKGDVIKAHPTTIFSPLCCQGKATVTHTWSNLIYSPDETD